MGSLTLSLSLTLISHSHLSLSSLSLPLSLPLSLLGGVLGGKKSKKDVTEETSYRESNVSVESRYSVALSEGPRDGHEGRDIVISSSSSSSPSSSPSLSSSTSSLGSKTQSSALPDLQDETGQLLRTYGVSNRAIFNGVWTNKKHAGETFFRKRFVWVDAAQKTFNWSKTANKSDPFKSICLVSQVPGNEGRN